MSAALVCLSSALNNRSCSPVSVGAARSVGPEETPAIGPTPAPSAAQREVTTMTAHDDWLHKHVGKNLKKQQMNVYL